MSAALSPITLTAASRSLVHILFTVVRVSGTGIAAPMAVPASSDCCSVSSVSSPSAPCCPSSSAGPPSCASSATTLLLRSRISPLNASHLNASSAAPPRSDGANQSDLPVRKETTATSSASSRTCAREIAVASASCNAIPGRSTTTSHPGESVTNTQHSSQYAHGALASHLGVLAGAASLEVASNLTNTDAT